MVLKSLQHLKRILGDGRIRRVYISEDGLKKLAYYFMYIPEQRRYIVFFCHDGREESITEDFFRGDQFANFRDFLRQGRLEIEKTASE